MRKLAKLVLLFLLVTSLSSSLEAQTSQDDEITRLNREIVAAYQAGNYDQALRSAQIVVDLTTKKLGKENIAVGRALKNQGVIENEKGDTKRAEKTLAESMRIFKSQPDLSRSDALTFADLLETLAAIKRQERFDAGVSYLELALRWREKANDEHSKEVAYTLAKLANINYWQNEYKLAAEKYKRSLLILSKLPFIPSGTDRITVLERARCSFRKAKMEDQFANVQKQYDSDIKLNPDPTPRLINGGVVNGRALSLPKPPYPEEARRKNITGSVTVHVLISEKGDIISACALSDTNAVLIETSELAAYKSKFSPTTLSGQPVKVSGTITYNYSR